MYWTITEYMEMAFRDLGHQLEFFDYRSFMIPGRLRDRIPAFNAWDLKRINRRLYSKIQEYKPDFFFVIGGYTLEPETIQAARRGGAIAGIWNADYPYLFERYLELGKYYDCFFASGKDALSRCARAGLQSHWLPFACVPEIHRPVHLSSADEKRFSSDILFFGTPYSERIRLFQKLTEFNLAIWGPGWDRLPVGHSLRPFIRGGPLKTQEWVKAVSGTKIAINYMGSSGFDMDPAKESMANSRVFELLGCGAFQLVDAKEDLKALFRSGSEMVWFTKDEEVVDIARYYLSHPEERKAIGQRAREAALKTHTYRHRVEEMLKVLGM